MNDKEATRKYATTGGFIDLCDRCFGYVEDEIPSIEGHGDEHSDHDHPEDLFDSWDDGDEPDNL